MRVLFVARYRSAAMRSKLDYLAQEPAIELLVVIPSAYQDELLNVHQVRGEGSYRLETVPLLGASSDPHRTLYRTLDFYLRSFRPDIIHMEEEPDSLAAWQMALLHGALARSARLIFHTWQNIDRPRSWYVEWIKRTTLRAADAVFCANEAAAHILQQHGFTKPTPLVPAVGVDTTVFTPCPEQAPARRPFTVGYVGRFVPEKGIPDLLQAIKLLATNAPEPHAGVRLQLIGGGLEAGRFAQLAATLGITDCVEFVAPQPPAVLNTLYCGLNALVLPSRTTSVWKEQMGRVLLEAMACGIPIVGSDSGAIPEVIGEAGLIYPEGDVNALAERLQQLRNAPELGEQLRQRGFERVQSRYSQQQLAAATYRFYRTLLAEQTGE